MAGAAQPDVRDELDTVQQRIDSLETDAAALDPLWLHPAMMEDMAKKLLFDKASEISARIRQQRSSDEQDFPVLIGTSLYLVDGPHFSDTTHSQVEKLFVTPASDSHWYNVHVLTEEPPSNQLGDPEHEIEMSQAMWKIFYDDDTMEETSGFLFRDKLYPDIFAAVEANYSDSDLYDFSMNAKTYEQMLDLQSQIRGLHARKNELSKALRHIVDIIVVRGDGSLNVNVTTLRYPDTIEDVASPTVTDFLERMVGSSRGRILLLDDNVKVVKPTTSYESFKKMLAEVRREVPRVQVIEEAHGPPTSDRPTKRQRPSIEGATPLHRVGSWLSSKPCTVYLLADRNGLVVVDDDTMEALCEHVHELDVAKLGAEQQRTGKPCPRC